MAETANPKDAGAAPIVDPNDYVGGKEGEKKDVKVYGTTKIRVETRFARVNKEYTLAPGQEALAKSLRLRKYLENRDVKIPKDKQKEWLSDILIEIVNRNCRDDPSIMLKSECPNFAAYLRDLALQLFKTKKLPIKDEEIEILGGIKVSSPLTPAAAKAASAAAEAEAAAKAAAAAAESTKKVKSKYGKLTIKIHIPRSALEPSLMNIDTLYNTINATMHMHLKRLREALNRDTSEITLSDVQSSIYTDMNTRIQNLRQALST